MLATLLGNYRIVQLLGEGGMGVVYVGQHEAIGRRVVIKVLRPELSSDAETVQRFFNEARAAASIRSPGIVQVFDFGTTTDHRAYIVMELLEGESLAARLRQRRYDSAECCRLGRQVANVLAAAHAAGIVHRDLKPANLFLVPDPEVSGGERVKVLDFGIAKLAGEARFGGIRTHTDLIMGTPHYMSPEQCRSASVADARSDIYSLGCILFEIACGRPPFLFEGIGDLVSAHLHEPPPYPQTFAPDMSPALSALIARMLTKHPDGRPQTMAAVGQALDDILRTVDHASGRPPTPLPVPPPLPPPDAPPWPSPMLPAQPVQLPRPRRPSQFSSIATTVKQLMGSRKRANVRRLTFVLGGLVILGAITAIAVVLANDHAGPPERTVSYAAIAAARHAADAAIADVGAPDAAAAALADAGARQAAAADAAADPPVASDAATAATAPKPTEAPTAAAVAAECQTYETAHNWAALAPCADRLKPLDPKRAVELATRAAEQARSASHIAALQAALRDDDLKRARTELDQVWPAAVEYSDLKRKYDAAEAHAIDTLATQLDSRKDASCEAYNQVLAQARAASPPHVTAEASRRVPCTPPPRCNADALIAKAVTQSSANHYADALGLLEEAYDCRPSSAVLQKALVVACNASNANKARSYWKKMSPAFRTPAVDACVQHGITEAMLNAP